MQDPNTFILAGWDFVGENVNGTEEFWRICEDKNYSKLDWQVPIVGDFVCPDGVEVFDFGYISGYWMAQNCQTNNNCAGTDLDLSGDMGLGDLFLWLPNWLEDQ